MAVIIPVLRAVFLAKDAHHQTVEQVSGVPREAGSTTSMSSEPCSCLPQSESGCTQILGPTVGCPLCQTLDLHHLS